MLLVSDFPKEKYNGYYELLNTSDGKITARVYAVRDPVKGEGLAKEFSHLLYGQTTGNVKEVEKFVLVTMAELKKGGK